MTHKIFDKLPDSTLPQYRTYTDPSFNFKLFIQNVYAKDAEYRKAFGLPFDHNFSLEKIAVTNFEVIRLLSLNEKNFMDAEYIKALAQACFETLNQAWERIKSMPEYAFYYINRDSALSQDIYFILNTILEY